jgi:hypothetical protein
LPGSSNGGVNGINAIEDGGEVKRGIKGGGMMAKAASEGGARWHGVAIGDEEKRQRSSGVGKGMELTGGPHMAVMREREGVSAGVPKVEENTPFGKYTNVSWAEGVSGDRRPAGCSRPARAGLDRMSQNLKKIPFRIKIKFLNILRLWKFAQGDLGGILT